MEKIKAWWADAPKGQKAVVVCIVLFVVIGAATSGTVVAN